MINLAIFGAINNAIMNSYIVQVVFAVIAVLFTAIVLEAPRKVLPYIAVLGGGSWFCYLWASEFTGHLTAVYISSFLIAVFSNMLARRLKKPVTIFFVPSFFPLVPGAKMYESVYYFITGQTELGNKYLLETLATAGIIALAIFTVDSIMKLVYKVKNHNL